MTTDKTIRVAEMFAGVGGFRLALDGYHNPEYPEFDMPAAGPFKTIWANQWEPPGFDKKQFAYRCYEDRFADGVCVNEDIAVVLDEVEASKREISDFDLLVGGFPCQDYSVARPLNQASGIEGKKGVLWWEIYRMLHLKQPKTLLLENVDRLLKSPSSQRGRDFAIMLSCLAEEGYSVEWRVINAAEYGMPQKRRRVYIFGIKTDEKWDLSDRVLKDGIIAQAFPVEPTGTRIGSPGIPADPYDASEQFGIGLKQSPFENAGAMQNGKVFTCKVAPKYDGKFVTLGDLLVPDSEVPEEYIVDGEKLERWEYLKGAKSEERTAANGFSYHYSEGPLPFPDRTDIAARTILTSEGGSGASRMKHIVMCQDGKRYRRLVPDELDQIQMFPKGWTNIGMTDGHRAFCMGNALVVGIPHEIGKQIAKP